MEHVVKPGQTLSEIANIFNTSVADICQANNIEDVNVIKVVIYRIRNGDVYIKPQEPRMMGQGFLVFYI